MRKIRVAKAGNTGLPIRSGDRRQEGEYKSKVKRQKEKPKALTFTIADWRLAIFLGGLVGIGVPIIVTALFLFLKMETEVKPDGLYVRYFPLHIHFKRFGREDLSECYARRYKPIMEYGGWGIRCSFRNGKAYNVSGNEGVQLVLSSGRKLLIGSQKADELAGAIAGIIEKH